MEFNLAKCIWISLKKKNNIDIYRTETMFEYFNIDFDFEVIENTHEEEINYGISRSQEAYITRRNYY